MMKRFKVGTAPIPATAGPVAPVGGVGGVGGSGTSAGTP